MAILEEWVLAERVDAALRERVADLVNGLLPERIEHAVSLEDASLYIDVSVPAGELESVAVLLDEPIDHFTGWSWREEIDALDGRDVYALRVEIAEKVPETFDADERELSILSAYSKDRDNLAAWPVAFVVAARLAHELGARAPEDLEDDAS